MPFLVPGLCKKEAENAIVFLREATTTNCSLCSAGHNKEYMLQPDCCNCCPTVVVKGFVAQKALSTAFTSSKILPHVWSCLDLLDFSNGNTSELEGLEWLLTSDASYRWCILCSMHRSHECWQWYINYTINNQIFVYRQTNSLTNEYLNI